MALNDRERSGVTRILLVTHGETEWSREDRFAGSSDVALSEDGRRQAQRLAAHLAVEQIAAIYSSPLSRAVETAGLLAEPHGAVPTIVAGLREMDFGDWEGRPRADVVVDYAPLYGAWTRDPAAVRTPHGESGYDVATRAVAAVKEVARAHVGSTIAVVSHRTVNRLILCQLLGIGLAGYRERVAQVPGALSCVELDARGRGHLLLLNDISFLEERRPVAQPPATEEPRGEASPAGDGARTWLIPSLYVPAAGRETAESAGPATLTVLNTSREEAHLQLDFFFADRPPMSGDGPAIAGQRVAHLRLDRPDDLGGIELPSDTPFGARIRSNRPVVVQWTAQAGDGPAGVRVPALGHAVVDPVPNGGAEAAADAN